MSHNKNTCSPSSGGPVSPALSARGEYEFKIFFLFLNDWLPHLEELAFQEHQSTLANLARLPPSLLAECFPLLYTLCIFECIIEQMRCGRSCGIRDLWRSLYCMRTFSDFVLASVYVLWHHPSDQPYVIEHVQASDQTSPTTLQTRSSLPHRQNICTIVCNSFKIIKACFITLPCFLRRSLSRPYSRGIESTWIGTNTAHPPA